MFFHKSFNKRLIKHISELDSFGLLPVDWFWNKYKVEDLDNISEELLDDLIHLHSTHQDLGDTIPHILPLIKELHDDIEVMLKENSPDEVKQKREVMVVNSLITNLKDSLQKQGYVRYGTFRGPIMYLTPKEIAYYCSLVDESKWKKALKFLKRKWNERVDRAFIQSINTIHWGHLKDIEHVLVKMNKKQELSCVGYEKLPFHCFWIGGLGILMSGYVTLAGNVDLQSKQWSKLGKSIRYTEFAERLILNDKTFISSQGYDPSAGFITFGSSHNEFIVSNWKPKALIFDKDKLDAKDYEIYLGKLPNEKEVIEYLIGFSKQFDLPLIDINYN